MAWFGIAGIALIRGAAGMTTDPMKWLEQDRKLDGALLVDMGVQRVDHPGLGQAVAFAYKRNGEVYAAKFRTAGEKNWRSSENVSRGLYNEDGLSIPTGPIVITEGEIDALSVMQAGFDRAVSLPDGWTADGGKRDVLVAAEDRLRKSPYVVVAGDNDEAGASLPSVVANILAGHDVRYVTWPDGCKDANDVLVNFGEGELTRCIVDAKRIDPPGGFVTGISDLPPLPARRVLRVGLQGFDAALAFEVGAMSVGTGTPGAGKSTLTTFAAYHVACNEGVNVGFMSFETHPHRTRDHLARLEGKKPWDDMDAETKARVAHRLDQRFRIVHRTFDDGSHHLEWLRQMIYTLSVRDNCKLIIVDPWNELEHLPEPGESMTGYINFALQQIRTWAEQYDCHICLIAHPRKMQTDGKIRCPTGYDVADSAAFFNKPSLGFSVHQEQDSNGDDYVLLSTWKVRDTQLYDINQGRQKLTFNAVGMNYRPYEQPMTISKPQGA